LIALPDAFGTKVFLRDAPDWVADWTGFRPDSAPPIAASVCSAYAARPKALAALRGRNRGLRKPRRPDGSPGPIGKIREGVW
jgi:hypothetical protein